MTTIAAIAARHSATTSAIATGMCPGKTELISERARSNRDIGELLGEVNLTFVEPLVCDPECDKYYDDCFSVQSCGKSISLHKIIQRHT